MRPFQALLISVVFTVGCGGGDKSSTPPPVDSSPGSDSAAVDTPAGSDAAIDTAGATCSQCATTSCGTQLTACQADTVCKCTFDCFSAGTSEGQCKQTCATGGNTAWADMIGCLDAMCAGSC